MKKSLKRRIEILITFIMISTLFLGVIDVVKADSSTNETGQYKISLQPDVSSVKVGDTITITVVNCGDKINCIDIQKIEYDHNIFELKEDQNALLDSWTSELWSPLPSSPDAERCVTRGLTDAENGTSIDTISFLVKKEFSTSSISFSEIWFVGEYYDDIPMNENITLSFNCNNAGTTVIDNLYIDYTYQTPVTTNTCVLYANGSTVTAPDGSKLNYTTKTLYTDILPSYIYNKKKEKFLQKQELLP